VLLEASRREHVFDGVQGLLPFIPVAGKKTLDEVVPKEGCPLLGFLHI